MGRTCPGAGQRQEDEEASGVGEEAAGAGRREVEHEHRDVAVEGSAEGSGCAAEREEGTGQAGEGGKARAEGPYKPTGRYDAVHGRTGADGEVSPDRATRR